MYNSSMEPDQSPPPSPVAPLPSGPKNRLPLILILSCVGGLIVLVVIIFLIIGLLNGSGTGNQSAPSNQSARALTIGTQPYLYPCSVATRDDFARAFHLHPGKIGSADEKSALAAKDTAGGDLAKLAPSSTSKPRYTTSCSYTIAKNNDTGLASVDITLNQFSSGADAKRGYDSLRSTASNDFTLDDIDNGSRQLDKLPSFATSSFVRLPDSDQDYRQLEATFIVNSRVVELAYGLADTETTASAMPMLDAYAVAIKAKIDSARTSQPTDLTGTLTVYNKKFVDLCRQTDLGAITRNFSIDLRPDDMRSVNIYGSLRGSLAAADGVISDCQFGFMTATEKQALKKHGSSSKTNTSDTKWPHRLNIDVSTFASNSEAKNAFTTKKAKLARPSGGITPAIDDIKGVGDAAFVYRRSSVIEGALTTTFIDDNWYVLKDAHVFSVGTQRQFEGEDPDTMIGAFSDDQFKAAISLLQVTLDKAK